MALFPKLHDNTLPFWNNDSERQSKSIMVANSIPHESEFQYLRRVMIVKIFIDARATGGIYLSDETFPSSRTILAIVKQCTFLVHSHSTCSHVKVARKIIS